MTQLRNTPNSQSDVLTTVTHFLFEFEDLVRNELPSCAVTYDDDLTYESALRRLISSGNYSQSDLVQSPIFAYNRTVLRQDTTGMGLRTSSYSGTAKVGNDTLLFTPILGEFDINFMYISKSIRDIETFEVTYFSDEGITYTKEIEVDMQELGKFTYFLNYAPELSDMQNSTQENFYKAVLGTITIKGAFFTFVGKSSIINEIRERIIIGRNPVIEEVVSDYTIQGSINV